ncbi:hypothetical protein FIBSPDRAFT_860149, partial [Athelia psychrophila]
MARGKPYSDDLREVIISLARHLDIDSIVQYTEGRCKHRSIERLLAEYRRKGLITCKCTAKNLRGAKRTLTAV